MHSPVTRDLANTSVSPTSSLQQLALSAKQTGVIPRAVPCVKYEVAMIPLCGSVITAGSLAVWCFESDSECKKETPAHATPLQASQHHLLTSVLKRRRKAHI